MTKMEITILSIIELVLGLLVGSWTVYAIICHDGYYGAAALIAAMFATMILVLVAITNHVGKIKNKDED